MFFQVKIFDSSGELKKVVTPKRLSNRFWKKNENAQPDFKDNELNSDDLSFRNSQGVAKVGVDDSL